MAEKTKHHPGTILERVVNAHSKKLAIKDTQPERQYHYAQLRTAMKHLMPENARLKAEVEILRKENALLKRELQAFRARDQRTRS